MAAADRSRASRTSSQDKAAASMVVADSKSRASKAVSRPNAKV